MKDYIVDTELDLINLFKNLGDLWQEKRYLKVVCKTNRSRTGTQNNAIHKYCRELAEELNAAGYTSQVRFKGRDVPGIEVEWTQDSVKALWSALQIDSLEDSVDALESIHDKGHLIRVVGKYALSVLVGVIITVALGLSPLEIL